MGGEGSGGEARGDEGGGGTAGGGVRVRGFSVLLSFFKFLVFTTFLNFSLVRLYLFRCAVRKGRRGSHSFTGTLGGTVVAGKWVFVLCHDLHMKQKKKK